MKKIYALLVSSLLISGAYAQTIICNASGNLMLFTNYDGGNLNIVVDVNIPNLKIGVCSYEGTAIIISGAYASNVTGVAYAGYNSSNVHCGSSINTSISGAGSATTNISLYPPATLANAFGNSSIICGASCDITTYQGGCNTVDQIENYFLTYFPGSVIYAHKVQYGCWTANQSLSAGGTCCALATGVETQVVENAVSVFPNPASNDLSMSFQTTLNSATIKVFNVSGELVKEESRLSGNDVSLDISGISKGIYFVEVVNGNNISHTKFIKQ
jgi:hypothetical protein